MDESIMIDGTNGDITISRADSQFTVESDGIKIKADKIIIKGEQ